MGREETIRATPIDLAAGSVVRRVAPMLGYPFAAALFFSIASPFNAVTYLPFVARLTYWVGLVGLAFCIARLADGFFVRRWRHIGLRSRVALASIVAAPAVWIAIVFTQSAIDRAVPTHFLVQLLGCVWVVCLPLCLVALASPQLSDGNSPAVAPASPPRGRRVGPLGLPEGATVFALSAEDHYVRVHTDLGKTLILMRFGDAVESVAGQGGVRVHRSWWVAKAGVAAIQRRDGRLTIRLKSGICAPVSKAGAKALRSSSWL